MPKDKKDKLFLEELVKSVKEDFLIRQKERKSLERQWELNLNFMAGNQYATLNANGDIENDFKTYEWQEREVFNHITPIMESRMAKLAKVRPSMSVRASSDEDGDIKTAKLSTSILNSAYHKLDLDSVITETTMWSEICGTAFYKVFWNGNGGRMVGSVDGEKVYEGDVKIVCVPPQEIFPDSIYTENVEDLNSIMHVKAVPAKVVEEKYGVIVNGGDVDVFTFENNSLGNFNEGEKSVKGIKRDHVLIIEKYEKPSKEYKNGRMIVIADDKLLYLGELPYINGKDGERGFPFIKQVANSLAGQFFGMSLIERMIPIQRSYNAIKNRKHEFINRLSMGVVTVEDGSIDTDELTDEGLSPGKILVYRQGSNPPSYMNINSLPNDLAYEEERLSNEFILISGVSELSRNSATPSNVSSGTALQLLLEQDDSRLTVVADNIRFAVKEMAKHILRLYKQFATTDRLMSVGGDNKKVEVFYFNASDISSDDVMFDTENEIAQSPAQRKTLVFDLFNAGLLHDENGKISNRMRSKIIEVLGFGGFENVQDLTTLHMNKASRENLSLQSKEIEPEEYDDHETHLNEHIKYLISSECDNFEQTDSSKKQRFLEHIKKHKLLQSLNQEMVDGRKIE